MLKKLGSDKYSAIFLHSECSKKIKEIFENLILRGMKCFHGTLILISHDYVVDINKLIFTGKRCDKKLLNSTKSKYMFCNKNW